MAKSLSVVALIVGVALAVTMRSAVRADPPQPGPDLPALAQAMPPASRMIDSGWPATDAFAGQPTDVQAAEPWPALPQPDLAGRNSGAALRIGAEILPPLARLQSAPTSMTGNPLLMPGQDAGLNDGLRLEFAPAPEPHNWVMFIAGMTLIGVRLRRRPYLATL